MTISQIVGRIIAACIILIAIRGILFTLFDEAGGRDRGELFEIKTAKLLQKVFPEAKIFRNVIFHKANGSGETTEIDIAVLTDRGILAFECKARRAIIGSLDGQTWGDGTGNNFYSPYLQNEGHRRELAAMLDRDIGGHPDIFNIICVEGMFSVYYFGMERNSDKMKSPYFGQLDDPAVDGVQPGFAFLALDRTALRELKRELEEFPISLSKSEFDDIAGSLECHVATKKQRKEHRKQQENKELTRNA